MTPAPVKTHWGCQREVGFDTFEEQLDMKREKSGSDEFFSGAKKKNLLCLLCTLNIQLL